MGSACGCCLPDEWGLPVIVVGSTGSRRGILWTPPKRVAIQGVERIAKSNLKRKPSPVCDRLGRVYLKIRDCCLPDGWGLPVIDAYLMIGVCL